ncbi:glycosyltransferase family 39 protein [Micromonosporaceae bacterium Da 78-11]
MIPIGCRRGLSWTLPALVAAFVVTWQAAVPGPWRDEFASWSAATRTAPEILDLGRHIDGVLVPYYLLLHVWIGWFGDSVLAMRVPSLVAMTATAAVVARLGQRLWGPSAGLLGGLLFAVLPVTSRYAQEIRGYAFATLFATLSCLFLVEALRRSRWWWWGGYGLCVALIGLAHLVSLLVLAGHLVAVVTVCRRDGRWRALWWLLAASAGLAVVLPLTLRGLGQHDQQLNWLDPASVETLVEAFGSIFGSSLLGGLVAGLAVAALRTGRAAALGWVTVLLSIGLLYAYDQVVSPIFVGRYLLFVVPLLCALAGAGLTALRRPVSVGVVVLVGLLGWPAQLQFRSAHSGYDYQAAARVIESNAAPGDGIVYAPRDGWQLTDVGLGYYLRERAPRDVLLATDERAGASLWATECAEPLTCLTGVQRLWVVRADPLDRDEVPLTYRTRAALTLFDRLATWRVDGFTAELYVRAG